MVCQNCVDGETCPECEKYPHDIHTTPPPQYEHTFRVDMRTPDQRIADLERDVHDLKNQVAALMMKMELVGI